MDVLKVSTSAWFTPTTKQKTCEARTPQAGNRGRAGIAFKLSSRQANTHLPHFRVPRPLLLLSFLPSSSDSNSSFISLKQTHHKPGKEEKKKGNQLNVKKDRRAQRKKDRWMERRRETKIGFHRQRARDLDGNNKKKRMRKTQIPNPRKRPSEIHQGLPISISPLFSSLLFFSHPSPSCNRECLNVARHFTHPRPDTHTGWR